jgi:DNA-binding PadR family transcriptional regulator
VIELDVGQQIEPLLERMTEHGFLDVHRNNERRL